VREIHAKAKTIRELLKGVKYSIDYYQREYKWQEKQIRELVDDLAGKFLEDYDDKHSRAKVATYPHYFLGSIINQQPGRRQLHRRRATASDESHALPHPSPPSPERSA
jgi:uncharacterized protein with ParB-like and HNH nuclease domain